MGMSKEEPGWLQKGNNDLQETEGKGIEINT